MEEKYSNDQPVTRFTPFTRTSIELTPEAKQAMLQGATYYTTDKDKGLVGLPMLAPHLEANVIEQQKMVILISDQTSYALYGELYVKLVPLLDGSRTREQIITELCETNQDDDNVNELAVSTVLVNMATKRYVVSADAKFNPKYWAFWSSLGYSPSYAEQRLSPQRIKVVSMDGMPAAELEQIFTQDYQMTLAAENETPTLYVAIADDFIGAKQQQFNLDRLKDKVPWVLISGNNQMESTIGPVFRPDSDGPCWACVAFRMRANREVKSFLGIVRDKVKRVPSLHPPKNPLAHQWLHISALEICRWMVAAQGAGLHEHLFSMEAGVLSTDYHHTVARPQCRACGDPKHYAKDRQPIPIKLAEGINPKFTSGGLRKILPLETLARYRHQVSHLTGVVTQLVRTTDTTDNWFHVYWAGSNLAMLNNSFGLLRNSLRSKSSGKGATPQQAEASALCEAVERYSGVFQGNEISIKKRFSDFADDEAVHPNAIMGYSDAQYDNRKEINGRNNRFYQVPEPFDVDAEREWTPIWSLTHERFRYIPTGQLYFSYPMREYSDAQTPPDSNGCASGNTFEEAVLQGIMELVERDSFAMWWYNRLRFPELDVSAFKNPFLEEAYEYYHKYNRSLRCFDVSSDLDISVVISVSYRTDKEKQDIIVGAGAHFDPHIATLRSICELNQYLQAVRDATDDPASYIYDDKETLRFWHDEKIENLDYLSPLPGKKKQLSDFNIVHKESIRDYIYYCRDLFAERDMDLLILDQTRPDVGMPVAKTLAPGLRHFWARFDAGRLYDVPVEMKWLDTKTPEEALNPIPVFI